MRQFFTIKTKEADTFALFEPPIKEEKYSITQALVQFKAVNATKKDASDIIQTFQKLLCILSCIIHRML